MHEAAEAAGLAGLEARLRHDLACLNHPPANWVPPRPGPGGRPVLDVLLVGAGMCGLAALFALHRLGIGNVLAVDRADGGAEGPWVTYARMPTLRSPKHLASPAQGLPSLTVRAWYEARFGAAAWDGLHRLDRVLWMDYLRWYRRVLDLPVRNGVEVTDIVPVDGCFRVETRENGTTSALHARKVVLSNGRDGLGGPWLPAVAGRLPADRHAHSADAIDFAGLRGRRVAVVGGGSSAFDNAATALEAGAARVDMLVRRAELPTYNRSKGIGYAGWVEGFPLLPAAERWRLLRGLFDYSGPPRESVQRCGGLPGFHLHLGCAVDDARAVGDGVRLTTGRGVLDADFAIFATGFSVEPARRPELRRHADAIALWADRYVPPTELASAALAGYPWLGPAFEFAEKRPGEAPWLKDLHCYNQAASLSHGLVAGDIPGVDQGAPRLAAGIARDFFLEDRATHFARLRAYDQPELLGDELPAGALEGPLS